MNEQEWWQKYCTEDIGETEAHYEWDIDGILAEQRRRTIEEVRHVILKQLASRSTSSAFVNEIEFNDGVENGLRFILDSLESSKD